MKLASNPTSRLTSLLRIALFAALISFLSLVTVPLPFSPIPVTGQTLGVMLAGLSLGPKLGAVAVVLYLLMGIAGLPVFAGFSSGLGVLAGASGGYLLAFPLGAFITGLISRNAPGSRKLLRYFVGSAVGGILVPYTLGCLWLARLMHLTLTAAVSVGAAPFLPGDLFKAAAASLLVQRLEHILPIHYKRS